MVFLTRYNFAGNVMEQFIAFHCKLLLIPAQLLSGRDQKQQQHNPDIEKNISSQPTGAGTGELRKLGQDLQIPILN